MPHANPIGGPKHTLSEDYAGARSPAKHVLRPDTRSLTQGFQKPVLSQACNIEREETGRSGRGRASHDCSRDLALICLLVHRATARFRASRPVGD